MQNTGNIHKLNTLIAKQQWDNITDEDWETLLAALNEKRDWEQMWRLAQIAPVMWSVRLLLRLKEAAWRPGQDAEREAFTQLAQLAEECSKEEADILGGGLVDCHTILRGFTRGVTCITISPDGQLLAHGGGDGIVRLWRLPDGTALKTLEILTDDVMDFITCVAISSDGRVLASGGVRYRENGLAWDLGFPNIFVAYNIVGWWCLPDGAVLHALFEYTKEVSCLAISSDEQLLASGSKDGTIRLWSLPRGTALQTLEGHTLDVMCLTISPNGQMLVSGSGDKTVRLWHLPDGATLQILEGHTLDVTCLAISSNGQVLVSGSLDTTIRLWSLSDGATLQTLEGHTDRITCVAISPDGRVLVSGSSDHTVRLWSLPDGTALKTLRGHSAEVSCLAISPDRQILASGSRDGTIRLWAFWKLHLRHLISEPTRLKHLKWVEDTLKKEKLNDTERKWLEFLLVLMRWQRRFDVELGETPRSIPGGEFDVEIDA